AMIDDAGPRGLPVASLVTRAAVDPADVDVQIAGLVSGKKAARAGDILVAPAILERVSGAIVALLTDHHRAQPLSEGVPRDELRERAFAKGHPAVFDRAIADLEAAKKVIVRDRVALATHRVELSPEEDRARQAIERAFRSGGLKPPETAAIAADAGVTTPVADRVLKLLQRQKVLVRVYTLLFHD